MWSGSGEQEEGESEEWEVLGDAAVAARPAGLLQVWRGERGAGQHRALGADGSRLCGCVQRRSYVHCRVGQAAREVCVK